MFRLKYPFFLKNISFFSKSNYFFGLNETKYNIINILTKEITLENENYLKEDTIEHTLKELDFELIESDFKINLTRRVNDFIVFIEFEPINRKLADEEKNEEEEEDNENIDKIEPIAEFTIFVNKIGDVFNGFAFECSSLDGEINIHYINFLNDLVNYKKIPRIFRSAKGYFGPKFSRINQNSNEYFIHFLKSLGLNTDLAFLIEHLSYDKEQRKYIEWLNNYKNQIEK